MSPVTREMFSLPLCTPKLGVVFTGNFGIGVARGMLEELNPAEHQHVFSMILHTDHNQLIAQFGQKSDTGWPKRFQEWWQSGTPEQPAVTIIPLGTGMGTGGKFKVGAELATANLDKIRSFAKSVDTLLMFGGGGGGTSGVMPVIAKAIKDEGKHLLTFITQPGSDEGASRIALTQETKQSLWELCPTNVIYNGNVTAEESKLDVATLWHNINKVAVMPTMFFMRALIQDTGIPRNVDLNDYHRAIEEGGNYVQVGGLWVKKGGEDFGNDEHMSVRLLGNPYQNNRIIDTATRSLFWFHGKYWTEEKRKLITGCVQNRMLSKGTHGDVDLKWGLNGVEAEEPWMGFMTIAKQPPADESTGLYPLKEEVESDGDRKRLLNGDARAAGKVRVVCLVKGVDRPLDMKPSTRDNWSWVMELKGISEPDSQYPKVAAALAAVKEDTGELVDLPRTISYSSLMAWQEKQERGHPRK